MKFIFWTCSPYKRFFKFYLSTGIDDNRYPLFVGNYSVHLTETASSLLWFWTVKNGWFEIKLHCHQIIQQQTKILQLFITKTVLLIFLRLISKKKYYTKNYNFKERNHTVFYKKLDKKYQYFFNLKIHKCGNYCQKMSM